jgi:hypothetical protein
MATASSTRELRDFRLRSKADTGVADPTRWAYTDGNSFDVTVGGTASDGDYVVTIVPILPYAIVPTADPSIATASRPAVTVTRATTPATNTNIATQFVTNANVALAASAPGSPTALATYIESVSSSGAVTSWIAKRGAPPFIVLVTETTATGTLTLSPDDVFPVTHGFLGFGPTLGARTYLELNLVPVTSAGVPLPPGTLTVDLTVRRYFERGSRSPDRDIPSTPVGWGSATTASAWPVGSAYRIPGGGGRFGVSLGAVAGAVGSGVMARLEVHVREVTQ